MLAVFFWRVAALVFVALGLVGAVVPGMPTTIFMILAAWASAKGWPWLNLWLINHPRFGPPIDNWHRHRVIPRRAKWMALACMSLSAVLIVLSPQQPWVKWLILSTMAAVLAWLLSRRENPPDGPG